MEIIIVLLFFYVAFYGVYLIRLISGYGKVRNWTDHQSRPETAFSVVIPFRNEARNLPGLLKSLNAIDYPKDLIEYIFVDDFSTDDSVAIINKWRLEHNSIHTTLIESVRVSRSPKKDAINRAVPIVAHPWILTTDADCLVGRKWLHAFNDFIVNNTVSMIAGPVVYSSGWTPGGLFQRTDMIALQGATIGGFGLGKAFMSNGANFAFSKKLFLDLNGFSGNETLASGDDVFLLQKAVERFPDEVHYLRSRDAIVTSKPVSRPSEIFFQRVRWASKASSYISVFGETLAVVVFFGNAAVATAVVLSFFGMDYRFAIGIFLMKVVPDLILLWKANAFLREGKFILPILPAIIYPFVATLVGLYSIYGKYRWKGRTLT